MILTLLQNMKSFCRSLVLLAFGLSVLLCASCAHQINYDLTEADKWTGQTVSKSVFVDDFIDDAPKDEKINIRMGKELYRINARQGYPGNGDLSAPVSTMIGRHLEHSDLFENVYYSENPVPIGVTPDYTLSGTIYDYHGLGKMNAKAEFAVITAATVANLPGALGAMALTKSSTSEVQSSVRLNDVALKAGQKNVWEKESIHSKTKRVAHFLEGDNKGVFILADEELRKVTNEMIYDIGKNQTGSKLKMPTQPDRTGFRLVATPIGMPESSASETIPASPMKRAPSKKRFNSSHPGRP